MKFQKKLLALVAAGLLMFGVAACEGDTADTTDPVTDPTVDPTIDDTMTEPTIEPTPTEETTE